MTDYSEGYKQQARPDKTIWDPTFAGPYWIYGSMALSWVLDLFPWRDWPFMPNFLPMTLVFWAIYQPEKVYYWLVFLLGLMNDTDKGAVFGQNALALLVIVFLTELMSQRLQWLQKVGQAITILPIFLIGPILMTFESFCFGMFQLDWGWFSKALMCTVLWPAWSFVLSRRFLSAKS